MPPTPCDVHHVARALNALQLLVFLVTSGDIYLKRGEIPAGLALVLSSVLLGVPSGMKLPAQASPSTISSCSSPPW